MLNGFISYWMVPIFSGCVWLAMLLAMLITWLVDGSPRYASMSPGQKIAYISDVGATGLKPLFIAMSAVTVVTLDLAFIAERWLRHAGRLAPNTSWVQKTCSILSIIASIAGAAGLILLSIFDTLHHPRLHNGFLVLFIGGYIISAIFICAEYQRLGIHFREHRVLRISFWIKLFFILIEIVLAIAFGVTQNQGKYNVSAVLEWVVALVFTFYVWSFFLDFVPAVKTKHHESEETEIAMAEQEATEDPAASAPRGRFGRFYNRPNATAPVNGHANGHVLNGTNGNSNRVKPAPGNF